MEREFGRRLGVLRGLMRKGGLGAFYSSKPEDVFYLTGRGVGRVLVTLDGAFLWVRGLYLRLYGGHYGRIPYVVFDVDKEPLKRFFGRHRFSRVGVGDVSASGLSSLRRVCGGRVVVSSVLARARAVKSGFELGCLKKSASIASSGMRLARSLSRVGRREIDVAAEVECFLRKRGSESPPFYDGMLFSSGPRSADVHAKPSAARIGRGVVLVDLGAKVGGYYSDVSRTFCVGRPSARERGLLEFVGNLRDECVDLASPGVRASELFEHARREIEKRRLKFYHSLGHGVGLEVHESPSIGAGSKDVLMEGMVFTIEPGVYVPRRFGVRFEDTVVLRKGGAKKLT